ncbi:hypothetical protein BCR43DRAFT_501776 [Syncephalastrum racemosum]|uniref:Uncharacterized protein n=1 Tax=Syncephalastrum racemosum TaxID=13706 RepID=A0A1X2HX07_SYNRA|nr:hypothetical protein BCR43DRAFT_501776 [Syncephalastrum racemosum]
MRFSLTLVIAATLLLASPLNAAPAVNVPLTSRNSNNGLAKRDFLENLFNNIADCAREECSEFTDNDSKQLAVSVSAAGSVPSETVPDRSYCFWHSDVSIFAAGSVGNLDVASTSDTDYFH